VFERYRVYRKVEDRLRGSDSLATQDQRLLVRRYCEFLKYSARHDGDICDEFQGKFINLILILLSIRRAGQVERACG
jgi:hypothetical protein